MKIGYLHVQSMIQIMVVQKKYVLMQVFKQHSKMVIIVKLIVINVLHGIEYV